MQLKVLLFFVSLIYCTANAQWENLNTGINDNLNGVVFFQQNGIVSGENGLYYTANGGAGGSSWTELHIPSNPVSATFEDTKFTHCYAVKTNTGSSGIVYACGQTVSDRKAVMFKISIPSMTCELIYQGAANTKLNKIDCQDYYDQYYAVGDNGKMLNFSSTGTMIEVVTNTTENLVTVASSSSTRAAFGGGNKVWTATVFGAGLSDFGGVQNSSIEVKDICNAGSVAYIAGGNRFNYVYFNNSGLTASNSNFSIPLDANAVISTNRAYVGTSHGIYKYISNTSFATGCLEWQPSSLNHHINEFWFQTGSTYTYACGNNGVLLRTSNEGGASVPYVAMNITGTCVNGTVQFTALTGSGNSANWFIDNQLASTSLTGFSRTFTTAGQYQVRLEVRNSFNELTTVSQYINIVNIPAVNKPITISDNILCKAEAIQISIENSEPNVKYILRKEGQSYSNYGESPVGNGGTIVLNSALIDLTDNYYIDAVSTLANCSRRFDANFLITVEETKADFHSGSINAYVNDPISYFNQSFDAQNYAWQFNSASGLQTSNVENPQNSYSAAGQVTVNLDAWSNNNCHDVVTENGPNIINPVSNPPDCMLLINSGPDVDGPYDISKITPVNDGFLTCGPYNNYVFDSEYGVTHSFPNQKGGYLTKHDSNGVLKWIVYSADTGVNDFSSCVQDLQGNIYFTGGTRGKLHDNSGKIFDLGTLTPPSYTYNSYFLIKLNSKGEILWRIQSPYLAFRKVFVDKSNNVIVQTEPTNTNVGYQNIPLYYNDVFVQNVGNTVPNIDSTIGIIKLTPSGAVLWDTEIKTSSLSYRYFDFDAQDNIYYAGGCESSANFYSTSGPTLSVAGDGTYVGKFVVVKYSSSGNALWVNRSRTRRINSDPSDDTVVYGLAVENNGDIFITGRNECVPISMAYTHVFENADGTITENTKGTFYLAKMNTNGVIEWIRSTVNNAYGGANALFKDSDELFVLGGITSGNSNVMSAAEFEGGANSNYNLVMNRNNYVIFVYDFSGNLKRVFANTVYDNASGLQRYGTTNFFKDNNDNFYLSRNMRNTSGYVDFGNVMPAVDGTDGVVIKFKESCGVMLHDVALSAQDNSLSDLSLSVYPNPTSDTFSIDLKNIYQEVVMEVYDIYGKIVKKEKYLNQEKIATSLNCSSGVYFIKMNCDKNVQWLKLIKK